MKRIRLRKAVFEKERASIRAELRDLRPKFQETDTSVDGDDTSIAADVGKLTGVGTGVELAIEAADEFEFLGRIGSPPTRERGFFHGHSTQILTESFWETNVALVRVYTCWKSGK